MNLYYMFLFILLTQLPWSVTANDSKIENKNTDQLFLTVQVLEISNKDKRYIKYGKESGAYKYQINSYEDSYFMAFDADGNELGRFATCLKIYDEKCNTLLCIFSRELPWISSVNIKVSKYRIVTYDYKIADKIIGSSTFDVEKLKLKFVKRKNINLESFKNEYRRSVQKL